MPDPFEAMARTVLYATGTDCTITTKGSGDIDAKAGIRHITELYGEQLQGGELTDQVTVLNADVLPDDFVSLRVDNGLHAGIYTRAKKTDGDGKVSVFACIRTDLAPAVLFLFLLEDGSGGYALEDGSGAIALES